MKKTLLGFAALTLILASCSKNEVVDEINSEKGLIKFGAITGKVSTKAAETDMTALQETGVEVPVFALVKELPSGTTYTSYFKDDLTYSTSGQSGGTWAPSTKRYLKDKVKNEFYSIYPSQTGYTTADKLILPDGESVGFEYTVGTKADEDLLGAAATDNYTASTDGTTGVSVTLPFNHLLSQVNLGVQLDNTPVIGNGNVVITDIQFNQVGAKGTYTFETEGLGATNWTADATPTDAYKDFAITQIISTEDKIAITSGTESFFLPGGGAVGNFKNDMATSSLMPMPLEFIATSTITFKFRAYDLDGIEVTNGETEATIKLENTTAWAQGLRYIYVVDFDAWFANRLLKFTVTSSGWENHDWNSTDTGVVEVPSF